MKSLLIIVLLIVGVFLPNILFAEVSPFGLEIGKATIEDVITKHNAKYQGKEAITDNEIYDIDVSTLSLKTVKSCRTIFNTKGILIAVIARFPKYEYKSLLETIQNKYKYFYYDSNSYSGGLVFKEGSTWIILDDRDLEHAKLNYEHIEYRKAWEEVKQRDKERRLKDKTSNL